MQILPSILKTMTTETIKPNRAEYYRKWRARNRDHCNQWSREYWKLRVKGLKRGGKTIPPLRDRFDAKWIPEPNSGCWLWTAYLNMWGYGMIMCSGKLTLAHRLSWQLHRGDIPEGIRVLHHCDTPACVNPEHLFLGTDQDNARDMARKGRVQHKLTREQVVAIKSDGRMYTEIAKDYNVAPTSIRDIKINRSWRHV